jgi:hypothetical protein
MPQLAVDEGALCVDSVSDALPTFDLFLRENAWYARVAGSLDIVSFVCDRDMYPELTSLLIGHASESMNPPLEAL